MRGIHWTMEVQMPNEVEQSKSALLESLSLYEQFCGVRGGDFILHRVRELQLKLVESLKHDESNVATDVSARAA